MSQQERCPTCGFPPIDTHQESADIGVGTLYGPKYYICKNQHGWSPDQDVINEVEKMLNHSPVPVSEPPEKCTKCLKPNTPEYHYLGKCNFAKAPKTPDWRVCWGKLRFMMEAHQQNAPEDKVFPADVLKTMDELENENDSYY